MTGDRRLATLLAMRVLVVADEIWVRNEVHAALTEPEYRLVDHEDPATAGDAVLEQGLDAVVVDLQVGSMGGMAVTRSVREKTGNAEDPGVPVVILLDRGADAFLAKRAGARGWLTKPFTSHELRTVLDAAILSETATP